MSRTTLTEIETEHKRLEEEQTRLNQRYDNINKLLIKWKINNQKQSHGRP